MKDKVYIVIINYNGWEDTIECLESILKSDYPSFQIIVVDNASSNASLSKLKTWSEGSFIPKLNFNPNLAHLCSPIESKPLEAAFYNKEEALSGGDLIIDSSSNPIIFIDAGENNGFAGGNNIGIKYALAKSDFGYVWLLNNDTVIEKNSLSELVKGVGLEENVAAVGSRILYYDEPNLLQSLGSKVDEKSIYKLNKPIVNIGIKNIDSNNHEEYFEVNDIMGASLLVKKEVIDRVGLLPEEYFLYSEETDWNFSFQKQGYKLLTIPSCKVYHKKNRSTGGAGNPTMSYYKTRNQFILYKKYKNIFIFNTRLYFFQYIIRNFFSAIFSKLEVRKAILKGLADGMNHISGKKAI